MGWMAIEKDGKEIGVVGDEAWDAAGKSLENLRKEINRIYQENFGRDANDYEFAYTIAFASGGLLDKDSSSIIEHWIQFIWNKISLKRR